MTPKRQRHPSGEMPCRAHVFFGLYSDFSENDPVFAEFLDRLADLVPRPRKHRHRYHGVFAPNRKLRYKALWWLQTKAEPAPLTDILAELHAADAVFNQGKTLGQIIATAHESMPSRSLAGKMGRDPRFVEIEDKQWLPAEACGFFRANGIWSIQLNAAPTVVRSMENLPVSQVVTFVFHGMLQREIVDATSAGVHRFINELLSQLFGTSLPPLVTPYVLADMLVVHSGGMIRHMRRRRLHWEAAAPGLQARGKRRWIGHAVTEAGQPMVLADLDIALRAYYQDYADYVIQQLHYHYYSINDDAGGSDNRVAFVTHWGQAFLSSPFPSVGNLTLPTQTCLPAYFKL